MKFPWPKIIDMSMRTHARVCVCSLTNIMLSGLVRRHSCAFSHLAIRALSHITLRTFACQAFRALSSMFSHISSRKAFHAFFHACKHSFWRNSHKAFRAFLHNVSCTFCIRSSYKILLRAALVPQLEQLIYALQHFASENILWISNIL